MILYLWVLGSWHPRYYRARARVENAYIKFILLFEKIMILRMCPGICSAVGFYWALKIRLKQSVNIFEIFSIAISSFYVAFLS